MTLRLVLPGILLTLFSTSALAATYTIPSGPLPPGCSYDGSIVSCPGNLDFRNNDTVIVSSPTSWVIGGDLSFGNNGFEINAGGQTSDLNITVYQNVNPGNNAIINANLTVLGNFNSSNNSQFSGGITISGNLTLGNNSVIDGNVTVDGTLNTGNDVEVNGNIDATNINLGQHNEINGNIETVNLNVNGNQTTINGNINATGTVTLQGTVNGYVNAPNINNNGAEINGPTCDENENDGPCFGGPGAGVLYYLIDHGASALTCQNEPITITACANADCSSTVEIDGAITLGANGPISVTGNANFNTQSSVTVMASLTEPGPYTLSIVSAENQADDPFQCSGGPSCQIVASDSALAFSTIPPQIAGATFGVQAQVIRTDDQTGACLTTAQNIDEIDLAVECIDPGSCTDSGDRLSVNAQSISELPAYTGVATTFNSQAISSLSVNYLDVGRIRLHAKTTTDQGANIQGSSNAFVVRPASIGIDVSNPITYDSGIFAKAGDPLVALLSAQTTGGVITPNFGRENTSERLAFKSDAVPVVPAGAAGIVQTQNAFSLMGAGVYASSDIRYTEAGTARFVAHVTSGDYLGTGPLEVNSDAIGRFIPWDYDVVYDWLGVACSADDDPFTYFGQSAEFAVRVIARNHGNQRMNNYPDVGNGVGIELVGADHDDGTILSDRIEDARHPLVWNAGEGQVVNGEFTIKRLPSPEIDGPFWDTQMAVGIDQLSNDEAIYGGISNPDFDDENEQCAEDANCYTKMLGSPTGFIFGRLLLNETYGSEFDDLPLYLEAQFHNGERFVQNRQDQCTSVDSDLFSIIENIMDLETQAVGGTSDLVDGINSPTTLRLEAPQMSGSVLFEYEAEDWLTDVEGNNHAAYGVFGQYGGHDRVLSWREIH